MTITGVHGGVRLGCSQFFADTSIDDQGPAGAVADGQPLRRHGNAVIQFVIDHDLDRAGVFGGAVERKGYRPTRWRPGEGSVMTLVFPGERSRRGTELDAVDLKRIVIVGQSRDPLRSQIGQVRLTLQTAHPKGLPVQSEFRFGTHGAEEAMSGSQIVQGHGRGIGKNAQPTFNQSIREQDLSLIAISSHGRRLNLVGEQPIPFGWRARVRSDGDRGGERYRRTGRDREYECEGQVENRA